MKCKITKIAIIMLGLLLPFQAFSASLVSDASDSHTKSVSLSASYKLSTPFFNHFLIRETNLTSGIIANKRVLGLKNDILINADEAIKNLSNFDFSEDYVPKYKNSLYGLSFLFGYSFKNLKVELEGLYESFDVRDTKNHIIDNNYRYFALSKQDNLNSDYVTLINNGVKLYSVILNICYDFIGKNTSLTPFLCVGIGEDIINIFDAVRFKPAFHAKMGFNYRISERAFLFMDMYYHKIIGNQYSSISVKYPKVLVFPSTRSSVLAELDIGYLGSEVGIRIFI
uniref:Omp-1-19 n=1 Tax=Ehrlichia ewingii TaxID=947 RepID=B1N6C2_9RICK|nr:Omp-1-19 [Ehrlichia ewingii]